MRARDGATLQMLGNGTGSAAIATVSRRESASALAKNAMRALLRNVPARYLRARIIELDQARALIRSAEAELADCEREVDSTAVMDLVAASACSAYDCEFVALARQLGIPLVTEDAGLLRAFSDATIGLTVALESP